MLSRRSRIAVGIILSGAIVLLGCALGGAPTGAGASTTLAATATPVAPTATPTPPPHALAWFDRIPPEWVRSGPA